MKSVNVISLMNFLKKFFKKNSKKCNMGLGTVTTIHKGRFSFTSDFMIV